jgi:hypothetical protein
MMRPMDTTGDPIADPLPRASSLGRGVARA